MVLWVSMILSSEENIDDGYFEVRDVCHNCGMPFDEHEPEQKICCALELLNSINFGGVKND